MININLNNTTVKCQNCYHYKVCYETQMHLPNGEIVGSSICNHFIHNSLILELVCNVNDTLYVIYEDEILPVICYDIRKGKSRKNFDVMYCVEGEIKEPYLHFYNSHFNKNSFGKSIFKTREEAEKKLKQVKYKIAE